MLVIREATVSDAPLLVEMVRELADFERELDQVDTTPDGLIRDGFDENPRFHSFSRVGWSTGRIRPLLFHVLDLGGTSEPVRRGLVCSSPLPGQWHWDSTAQAHGCYCKRKELLRHAMGSAQLEHCGHRVLQLARGKNAIAVVASTTHGECLPELGITRSEEIG